MRQRVRYLKTSDGVRLAWAEAGHGPALVKAANWLTHLEYDWNSPAWRHWMNFFASHFRFIRFDERGCGMSDWNTGDLSFRRWVLDLENIVDAARPREPFALLGMSQGGATAIAYAVKYPERVSHLVLYGAYARGRSRRGDPEDERRYRAMLELARFGWGRDNAVFRELFTSELLPDAGPDAIHWLNELCRKTVSGENACRLLEARCDIDVSALLRDVRVPTLVVHGRGDQMVPVGEGRLLAAEIPGAEFVELDSRNHILLESEPAWRRFQDAVREFTSVGNGDSADFDMLTPREREVLAAVTLGLRNAEIARRLFVSEKTVRNHLSNIFAKLGVRNRAEAIVLARDRDFPS